MKVVIATPVIYDKTSPFNHLFGDIIGGFLDAGCEVIRLVAVENRNDTDFKYGYEGEHLTYKLYKRKPCERANIISRYLRDTVTSIRQAFGILRMKSGDVLFEDACYTSLWPVLVAKRKKMRVVLMLQDVWPDNAVQTGLIRDKSLIYYFFDSCQRYIYGKADRIICISDDMKEFLQSKKIPAEKIEVIYNWGYSDDIVDIPWDANPFVKKYHLSDKLFYAVYAGNIGRMQNVEVIIRAADRLKECAGIHFLIVGDGAKREEIEKLAAGMSNVTMLPFQPSEMATSIYSMAGVNIIPLVPGGLKTALPSKIGVCLSCGNPMIACVDKKSKLEEMFTKYNCGVIVEPNNDVDLAEQILKISHNKKQKLYSCFENKFIRSNNVSRYASVIKE